MKLGWQDTVGTKRSRTKATAVLAVLVFLMSLLALVADAPPSDAVPAGFTTETVVNGLVRPTDVEFTANGLTLVAEMAGRIRVVDNGTLVTQPFVDLTLQVNLSSNRGLLGMAVHPDFPNTPYVYANYAYDPPETANFGGAAGRDGTGQRTARLTRITADAATGYRTAVPNSEVVLVGGQSTWANIADPAAGQDVVDQGWTCYQDAEPFGIATADCIPADGQSHSTGAVEFGPDGMLYFSNGDASSYNVVDPRAARSLDVDSLAGKLMRVDPLTGQGLADNPFFNGDPDSNRSKVVNLGLRNPFRFSIDQTTGELWIGDVGWTAWEEMNVGVGQDFGWPCYEGGFGANLQTGGYRDLAVCQGYYPTAAATPPVRSWNREGATGAALAGPTYTSGPYPDSFDGARFYADYSNGWIRYQLPDGSSEDFTTGITAMVDLELGPDGNLYLLDFLGGALRRFVYNDPGGAFSCAVTNNGDGSATVTWTDQGGFGYDVVEDGAAPYWVTGTSTVDTTPASVYTIAAWGVPADNGKTTSCTRPGDGNEPPQISNVADRFGQVGESVTFFVSATDPEGDDLTFTATGLPANVQLRPRVGEFAGTLTQAGTFQVTVAVSDGQGGSDTTSFTWIVTNPDFTCTATQNADGSLTVSWDDVGANGYDVTEDGAAPYWVVATSIVDSTPARTYSIRAWGLLIDNGRSTSCQAPDGNQPPTLQPIADRSDSLNSSVNFVVSANDPDNDAVTFTAAGLPPGPQLSLSGEIQGTVTQSGNYPVTITASDGNGGVDTTSFVWVVTNDNFACTVTNNPNGTATVTWNDQGGSGYDLIEDDGFIIWVTATSFTDPSPSGTYTVLAWGLPPQDNGRATSCTNPNPGNGFTCNASQNPNGSVLLTWSGLNGAGYDIIEDGSAPVWVTGDSLLDTTPGTSYTVVVWGLPTIDNGRRTTCSVQ